MADTTRTVEIIFKGNNQLGGSIGSVEGSLNNLSGDAEDATNSIDRLGDEVDDLGSNGADKINTLGAALQALVASAVVKEFVDANVAAESFKRGITALTGDASAAAQEFEYLSNTSDRLGLNLQSVSQSYLSLSASTRGTALEGEETRRIFEAVSGAMGLLGKSTADADGALQAISQIVSKGVVSMEELRQQLGERLPGAFQIAARSMGLTTQELNDLVATGELTAEEFLPAFARGLEDAFGSTERVDTFTASVNRLKNAISEAAIQVGDAGGFAGVTKIIQGVTAAFVGAVGAVDFFGRSAAAVAQTVEQGFSIDNLIANLDAAAQQSADNLRGVRDDLLDFGDGAKTAGDDVATLNDAADSTAPILFDLSGALDQATKNTKAVGEEISKTALELEKIASNERIANLDARVTLDVAGLEADAQKAVASIENIGTAIESTGDLLGSLFDNRLDADSWEERRIVEEQITRENERRETQLRKNNKLIDEQIKKLRAQTDALRRGDSLITIDGAGLQPHLEAFMFEILDALQVRVNAEGGDLLLGSLG